MNSKKKNEKSKKQRTKATRKRRKWLFGGAGGAALLAIGAWVAGTLSGASEQLVPVGPVVDKVATSDAIKVEKVYFDRDWPMAFEDVSKAERFAQQVNSGSNRGTSPVPDGGVPAVRTNPAVVYLRGNREQTITITNIRIDPIEKMPAITKALVCPLIEKGGGGDLELLDFDLDSAQLVGHVMTADGKATSTPYFFRRMVTLAKNEKLGFLLNFHTDEHHVRFSVTVDYQYGSNERGSIKVDDHGKPFEFTPLKRKDSARLWIVDPSGSHVNEVDARTDDTPVTNC
ncbi:hypothetical protein [Kribbella italica]|uniref:Uncharacterized protein n=1 Tax=Kribbella italica TaxID=1540520 RepID=A0A7W9MYA2_9ACTN|nr:hypothetical protein [Kribbella italica]MBB5840629.1 hypothetical protein [Kribbella italica]